jgi:hypothetical protein
MSKNRLQAKFVSLWKTIMSRYIESFLFWTGPANNDSEK